MTTNRDAEDYLTKAQESLASAEADYAASRFNSAANRSYFACFQAAVATLVDEGSISAKGGHEHHFIHSAFAVLVARRKLYPASLSSALPQLVARRQIADYRPRRVSHREAREALASARAFVEAVNIRVSRHGNAT